MTTPRTIRLRRIKSGSLFKLVLVGIGTVFLPLILFFGVLAMFGAKTVSVSGEHITGLKGLIVAAITAPVFVIFFSFFAWLGLYVGIALWGRFRPIELEYVADDEEPKPSADPPPAAPEPTRL